MATFLLVRHGQASLGAADYDRLSELGVRQSALLGEWWKRIGMRFDAVVTGELARHRDSAAACLAAMQSAPPVTAETAFDEYDAWDVLRVHRPDFRDGEAVGHFFAREANPARAFQALFCAAVERWVSGLHDGDYREPWPAFRGRVLEGFRALAAGARGEGRSSVAVFTSGGPITVICQEALGIPDARILELNWALLNAGITQVRSGASGWRLGLFNAVPHLEVARDASLLTHR
jgi:broad specificity phosphatase PhoE